MHDVGNLCQSQSFRDLHIDLCTISKLVCESPTSWRKLMLTFHISKLKTGAGQKMCFNIAKYLLIFHPAKSCGTLKLLLAQRKDYGPHLTPNNCKRKCFSHYGIWAMRLVWHFLFKNNENVCDNLSLPFYFSWFKCGEKSFVLSINNSSTIEQTEIWCLWHELKGSLTETFSCKTVFCMVLTKKYIYWSLSINFSPFTCFWKMTDHH